jgi:PAS domain S-box-containing protein
MLGLTSKSIHDFANEEAALLDLTKSTNLFTGFKMRIALSVIFLNLLVLGIAGLSLYQSRKNYEKKAEISTQNLASVLDLQIAGEIKNIDMALLAIKYEAERQIARGGIDKNTLDRYLIRQHSNLPFLLGLRMSDSRGDVFYKVGTVNPGIVFNVANRDHFIFERDNPMGDLFIAKPVIGAETKRWVLNIARRVNNPDGSFAGTIFGNMDINHFTKIFSRIDIGKKGVIVLRNAEMEVIARSPERDNTIGSQAVSEELLNIVKSGKQVATYKAIAGIDNIKRIFTYRKIFDYPLVIIVGLSKDEYLAEWRKEATAQLSLVALFTLGTLVSAKLLAVRWRREKEIESELRISKKDLEQRVKQRTNDLNLANEKLQIELSERRQIEEMVLLLKESVENSSDAIGMASPEGKHIYQNKSFTALFGEIGNNPFDLFVDQKAVHEMFSVVMAGGQWSGEVRMYAKDNRVADILLRSYANKDANGRIIGLVGIHTDITERKRAEEEREQLEHQLLHSQKLESLGVLAGGIAHDFNNILMAIIGNADLALMRINKESPAVENLHKIEQASARAADLAKQMLAYSGKGKFVIESLNLNCLLEEMLHMLEVSISKKAVLRFNLHDSLPAVEADATQLRQIIMNLVINASEAIGDKSGVIAITTGCMDCDRNYLKDVWLDENLNDGQYAYLEITDTGCGMDRETMAKIFDPFFTTKFTGRGLGMAAVLGIVRGHNGAIKVYSELKKGTTFKVLLPASTRPHEIFNHDSHTDDWHGSGTVLLVDDEETVRGVGKEMLQELGFNAITANDGRDALDIFKHTPNISYVILDLTMPHMDGEQCFRELKRLNHNVKVILSSGYNEQEVTQKFVGKGLAGFVQKPYKLSVLRDVLRKNHFSGHL